MTYAHAVRVDEPFEITVERVRSALAHQGFGVLTEIDVRATLQDKLGLDMEDYLILGACNPPLAHRALDTDRSIGALLPCNVVVRALGENQTLVEAIDPQTMVAVSDEAALGAVADEATELLQSALAELAAA